VSDLLLEGDGLCNIGAQDRRVKTLFGKNIDLLQLVGEVTVNKFKTGHPTVSDIFAYADMYNFFQAGNGVYESCNAYYDGTNWRRMKAGTAVLFFGCRMVEGPAIRFYSAENGAANSIIVWTEDFRFGPFGFLSFRGVTIDGNVELGYERFLKHGYIDHDFPTPGIDYLGKIIYQDNLGLSVADRLGLCYRKADESYVWKDIISGQESTDGSNWV